jgi:uncharacterized protein
LLAARDGLFKIPFDRVLLVAPPDPEPLGQAPDIEGEPLDIFNPAVRLGAERFAKELTIVGSDQDRWLPRGIGIYKDALGIDPVVVPGAGHFSLDDGFGPWRGLWSWIETGDPNELQKR